MSGFDIFGVVATIIGLLAIFFGLISSQLPSTKIKRLNAIYDETKDIFDQALEEGLLSNAILVSNAAYHLYIYNVQRNGLRNRLFRAYSIPGELIEMMRGLSLAISNLSTQIARLRADIMTASETERGKLMRIGRLKSRWHVLMGRGRSPSAVYGQDVLMTTRGTKAQKLVTPTRAPSTIQDLHSLQGWSEILPATSSVQYDIRRCSSCPPVCSDGDSSRSRSLVSIGTT